MSVLESNTDVESNQGMGFIDYVKESTLILKSYKDGTNLPQTSLSIVLGNESSDMDSFVSSLTWGYYLSCRNENKNMVLPVSCTTEKLFALRGDCQAICDFIGISSDKDLVYIDVLQKTLKKVLKRLFHKQNDALEKRSEQSRFSLRIHLVDQPNLPVMLRYWLLKLKKKYSEHFEFYIDGIVDHHKEDESAKLYFCKDKMCYKRVKICSSNTVNIGEAFREIEESKDPATIPSNQDLVYWVILATILIDSKGMDVSTGKVTKHDEEMVLWLKTKLENSSHLSAFIAGADSTNHMALYSYIEERKNNAQNDDRLTPKLALLKDFKIYELGTEYLYGISTLGNMSMDGFKSMLNHSPKNVGTSLSSLKDDDSSSSASSDSSESSNSAMETLGASMEEKLSRIYKKHMKRNSLNWMYIMCAYSQDPVDGSSDSDTSFKREFVAILPIEGKGSYVNGSTPDDTFGTDFITKLDLILKEHRDLDDKWTMWYFEQRNTKFSRKTLQPLLCELLESKSKDGPTSIKKSRCPRFKKIRKAWSKLKKGMKKILCK
jgi:inorganic pyrophosphatase/exopolyphosphatase